MPANIKDVGIYIFKDEKMAQELELIVELLREMKRVNNTSSEGFDRLLQGITKKLDILETNPASYELIKASMGELTQNIDKRYSTTLSKFTDIENAIKTVFIDQQEHVKNKDMQELFDIFSKNMNGFYTEAKQQKAILSGIETRLADLSNDKSDKEDILRTITLLRNDFENINHAYKCTIDDVNSNLKSILTNLIKIDQTQLTGTIIEQIDLMYKSINDVVNYLKSIEERDTNLEKLLSNVVTNETLKNTQAIIDSIIDKTVEISDKLNTISDKSDIEGLQAAAVIMNNRLDSTVSKEEFSEIISKTENLEKLTEDIKQNLANVTGNIEQLPDTNFLENSIQILYKNFDSLAQYLEKINLKEDIKEADKKISGLQNELSTIKNIVADLNEIVSSKVVTEIENISFENECYEIKQHVSKMLAQLPQKDDIERIIEQNDNTTEALNSLIAKTDIIADRLDTLPTHKDMEELNNNQLGLIENLQEVANKEDVENLNAKADEIEEMIDKLNFDNEFENIYDKTSSIENWLIESNIKENTQEISDKLDKKSEQKDLLEILNITKQITAELDELSQNADVKKVNRTVADVYQMLEELKNDLINTQEMHNDSVIVQLSELQKSITSIVSADEFTKFLEDLKDFISGIVNSTDKITSDFEKLHQIQEEIINKLENIDFSQVTDTIVNEIDTKLTTISDYLNSGIKIDNEAIKNSISEIKEIIENKKSNFDEVEKENHQIITSVQKYLDEIKNILETSDRGISPDLAEKINSIETELINYQEFNENQFTKILDRLNAYANLSEDLSAPIGNINNSMSELKNIKREILNLSEAFNSISVTNSTGYDISAFVVGRLNELVDNIDNLSCDISNGIQQGFAYNAELVEEKTSIILGFIKELRHASTNEIDLFERLTVTDNTLMDIQQELELINTDVLNDLTSKTDSIIEELTPIKEMILNLKGNNKSEKCADNIKIDLNSLHEAIQDDLAESAKYSKSTYEKLEASYTKITECLSETQNNIRDFILSDVDAVIIKIDNLKNELEDKLNKIAPPDASQMAEYHKFISEINTFKQEQLQLISETAQIKEKIDEHHDEIKSLLAVAVNNNEIIQAIDELKQSFKTKINNLSDCSADELGTNQYDVIFDNKSTEVIEEIKEDFNNFAEQISNLTEDNPEIEEVLNALQAKIDTIRISSQGDDGIAVEKNFDFIKAFDLLKQDIKNLRTDIEKAIPAHHSSDIKQIPSISSISNLEKNELLVNLNNKIDNLSTNLNKDWLEEIKGYIAGSEIQTILEDINGKIDILTFTDNSEWIDEIRQAISQLNMGDISTESNGEIQSMLSLINEKIDVIANSQDIELIEDVRDSVEASAEIKQLLNTLNEKVDILAMSPDTSLMDDIKDTVEKSEELKDLLNILNEKVDILATSQDTNIQEDSNELFTEKSQELKDLLNVLNEKVDIIASSQDMNIQEDSSELFTEKSQELKDLLNVLNEKVDIVASSQDMSFTEDIRENIEQTEELKELLDALSKKVDILAASDNQDDIDEILNAISEIENRINSIECPNNTADFEEIKDYLINLDRKTDIIAETDYNESLEDIRDSVFNIEDKIETFDVKPIAENVKKLSASDAKITSMLEVLNYKLDEISANKDTDTSKGLDDIRLLIITQTEYLGKLDKNNKTEAFEKCLKELTTAVNSLNTPLAAAPDYKQLQKSLREMKESIMAAVVTIFEQVSFVEESEDIKDFVEERTDVINQNLEEVTKQLRQITNSSVEPDYTYSMQDIESDLAKLRIALNELQSNEIENQANELANISNNVHRITSTVQELQNSFTPDEIRDIKTEITNLSIQTQEILDKTSNTDFEGFSKVITTHLANKVDRVTDMLEKSSVSDKVMRQALIYMGEWIDSASESMNSISINSSEIIDVKNTIEALKKEIPEQTDILNSIEEKFDEQQERLSYFEKQISKLGNMEEKFEQQQERIDRLEMSIEKILNAVEDIDDSRVTKKIDKLDKQLAKLSINIEKLASYVD